MWGTRPRRRGCALHWRHGTQRVAKAVLIGAVTPLMLKTEDNPIGLPMAIFDGIRAGFWPIGHSFQRPERTVLWANRPAPRFRRVAGFFCDRECRRDECAFDCIKAFSETTLRRT